MKIVEALKQIKDLARKADDLQKKVADHSADTEDMTPVYPDQKTQVAQWIQAHGDILRKIISLRLGVQRTNIQTMATIELEGKQVQKTLAEWILRRGVGRKEDGMALKEKAIWASLTDRNLRPKAIPNPKDPTNPDLMRVRRYYDPAERDRRIDALSSEPSLIDAALEIKNAVTDLVDDAVLD